LPGLESRDTMAASTMKHRRPVADRDRLGDLAGPGVDADQLPAAGARDPHETEPHRYISKGLANVDHVNH
jgi:hypothetical protein